MGERRMLDDEEVRVCLRVKERLELNLEYQCYLLHYAELMLTEGLEANFRKGRREFMDKAAGANDEVTAAKDSLKIINDQLKNGVVVKDRSEGRTVIEEIESLGKKEE